MENNRKKHVPYEPQIATIVYIQIFLRQETIKHNKLITKSNVTHRKRTRLLTPVNRCYILDALKTLLAKIQEFGFTTIATELVDRF